jgi:serine protease Do
VILIAIASCGFFVAPAHAQLDQDLRDVFERMLEDVDPDIRKNFQNALDNNSPEVEFTADEFRRFRDDPINPFEGIEEIDADKIDGNVILKFELPSLRNRTKSSNERQHVSFLNQFASVIGSASASTVAVNVEGHQVAFGVVVDARGLILTKASELKGAKTISCELPNGETTPATILKQNERNDLALLQVESRDLTAIPWSDEQPLPGAFVITPDHQNNVVFVGTYSVTPRSTDIGQQAFLGVKPEATTLGIRIDEVTPDTAAHSAGLLNGDIITSLDGVQMLDVSDLVNIIRRHRPGDVVKIEYLRGNKAGSTKASLAGRNLSGAQAAEYKMMNRLGAIPSHRSNGFPVVFQHDTPLFPEQCGGPIVDLDGHVIGMNIARNGRAASFAIPASHLKTILAEMLREDVAERQ